MIQSINEGKVRIVYMDLSDNESFVSILPLYEDALIAYTKGLDFISNKLMSNSHKLRAYSVENLIQDYYSSYAELAEGLAINEVLHIYDDCKALLLESDQPSTEYTDSNFEYNGFVKSTFVIHEHDSKRAPLHWDLRFKTEFGTSAYSFVLLKHRMPEPNNPERLLVKRQPMHPPQWVDMDHTQIGEGYGQGSVKTIDRGTIYYKAKDDNSFTFYLKGNVYEGAYHLINVHHSLYLLFNATNSILSDSNGRLDEWLKYASNFISYLNNTFRKKFGFKTDLITYSEIKISEDDAFYYHIKEYFSSNNILYIPSITDCLNLKKDSALLNHMISAECKINNIEDVMRLLILRNYVSPTFFQYVSKEILHIDNLIEVVFNNIRDVAYFDSELEELKASEYSEYMQQKVYRMFSDIYLGHKYYGQFDYERFLINLILYKKGI